MLFNELVEDWFNQGLGIDFARFHVEDGLGVPMGSIACRFSSPSKVGETLRLSLSVNHIGTSSVEMNVTGTSGGAVRVQATLTVVVAALKNHRSVPISADLRARLERYLVPPPA